MESMKIKPESVVERASVVNTDSLKMLEKLGPLVLTRLGLTYNRWHDRNSRYKESERITFPVWLDNFDRVNKLGEENKTLKRDYLRLNASVEDMKLELLKLRESLSSDNECENAEVENVENEENGDNEEVDSAPNEEVGVENVENVENVDNEEVDSAQDENDQELKTPRTEEEFKKIRKTIYAFNKKNYKLLKEKKREYKWGPGGCYNRISNKKSLKAWLESSLASEKGLSISILDDFAVCVVDDCLVTLDKDFCGGIGIESLWIPAEKYSSVSSASTGWKSDFHMESDPRHEYYFHGMRWSPKSDGNKRIKSS